MPCLPSYPDHSRPPPHHHHVMMTTPPSCLIWRRKTSLAHPLARTHVHHWRALLPCVILLSSHIHFLICGVGCFKEVTAVVIINLDRTDVFLYASTMIVDFGKGHSLPLIHDPSLRLDISARLGKVVHHLASPQLIEES